MAIKQVHGSTVSVNGCKVDIEGDVIYTIVPPRITGLHGTVHISGGPGCPNGDLHFEPETKGKVKRVSVPDSHNH